MTSIEKNIIEETPYLKAELLENGQALLCTTKKDYIPMQYFQDSFRNMGEFIKKNPVKKFIFDKTSLRVFHQASMEWYHVVWKKEMALYGLKTYRKILPDLAYFKMNVNLGRELIKKNNPDFKFEDYDIQYCNSVQDALEK